MLDAEGTMARLDDVRPESVGPELRPLVERIAAERGQVSPLYRVLLHSPVIARGWLALGTAVRLEAALDPKLRELTILQVGYLLQADYEFSHHYPIALKHGATAEQVAALPAFETSPLFDERERDALRFAKVSTLDVRVPDAVYEAVRRHLDPQTMLELAVTVSFYNGVCRLIHALGIELEPDHPSWLSALGLAAERQPGA
jgi:alkylhydroperoxidase family enzyme